MKVYVVASVHDTALLERCAAICAELDVTLQVIDPWTFDFCAPPLLDEGDALLRFELSTTGARVERHLFRPGLRTLHHTPLGPLHIVNDPAFHLRRAGVPMQKPWPVTQHASSVLHAAVEGLGGFPVVVSGHGTCVGTGALVAWNDADLLGTVRHLASTGHSCVLFAYPPAGELWRLSVLDGELLVAAHEPFDGHPATVPCFDDPATFTNSAPHHLVQLAVQAARAMGVRAATVDVLDVISLVDGAGTPLVLDIASPLDLHELIDVGGATGVDVLARVVRALSSAAQT